MIRSLFSPRGYISPRLQQLRNLDSLPVLNIINKTEEIESHCKNSRPVAEIYLSLYLQAKIKQYMTKGKDVGTLNQGESPILKMTEIDYIHKHNKATDKEYCKLKVTAIAGNSELKKHSTSLLKGLSKKTHVFENASFNMDSEA